MGRFKICLAIDKENRVLTARSAHGFSFGFFQPDLQFLLRDQALLTFILFRSGPLAPIVKLLIGDPSGLDPRKAPFVFLAVSRLEPVVRTNRIVLSVIRDFIAQCGIRIQLSIIANVYLHHTTSFDCACA